MGLEAATYIGQLVSSNPTSSDFKKEGDNHIRLIKAALQATFPNANRAFNLAEWAEKSAAAIVEAGNRTMLTTDDGKAVYFDCTAAARTYNLIAIADAPAGTIVFVTRDKTTIANSLTLDGASTEKINDAETLIVRAGESGFLYKIGEAGNEWAFFYTRTRQDWLFALSVVIAAAGDAAVFESPLASAARAPDIVAYRNRNGVNNDILGSFVHRGKNTAGTQKDLGRWRAKWIDVANGSEDAQTIISTLIAGAEVDAVTIGAGIALGAATNGPQGIGTMNLTGLYVNGVLTAQPILQHFPQSSTAQQAIASNLIPADDGVPLVSEGALAFTQAITPKIATSKIRIYGVLSIGCNGTSQGPVAVLFRGNTCIAVFPHDNVSSANESLPFDFTEVSGDLNARTYTVRYGSASGLIGLNIDGGSGSDYGDLVASSFNVTESLA